MKYKNTLNKGSVRYIVFEEDNVWYGVALEFNIVESGDNPIEVLSLLFESIEGYIETARKIKSRPMPLNQKPDKEYEDMWQKLEEKGKLDEKQVYSFGRNPFNSLVCA